jgi:hypothetical protein
VQAKSPAARAPKRRKRSRSGSSFTTAASPFQLVLYVDWMGLPNLDAAMGDQFRFAHLVRQGTRTPEGT